MNEELIEQHYTPSEPRQENIIQRYCAEIDTKIVAAGSKSDALTIVETACQQFESTCESEILLSALRQHLMDVVNHEWNKK
jgi:hypothetical protein